MLATISSLTLSAYLSILRLRYALLLEVVGPPHFMRSPPFLLLRYQLISLSYDFDTRLA